MFFILIDIVSPMPVKLVFLHNYQLNYATLLPNYGYLTIHSLFTYYGDRFTSSCTGCRPGHAACVPLPPHQKFFRFEPLILNPQFSPLIERYSRKLLKRLSSHVFSGHSDHAEAYLSYTKFPQVAK